MPCLQSASIWSSCEHNSKSEMLTEHVSELDSSFHSVLSLPSGKPPYKLINELINVFASWFFNSLETILTHFAKYLAFDLPLSVRFFSILLIIWLCYWNVSQ